MALRVIPLRGSSSAPTVRQRVTLDGAPYLLELQWNARAPGWFLNLFDAEGSPIALGIALVVNARLGRRIADPRAPGGWFFLLDRSGAGRDPAIDELGSRVELTYRDAADIAELTAPETTSASGGGGAPPPPGEL